MDNILDHFKSAIDDLLDEEIDADVKKEPDNSNDSEANMEMEISSMEVSSQNNNAEENGSRE